MVCTRALSPTDARDVCAAAGYTRAIIEREAGHDGVVAIALPKKVSPASIGLNDRDTKGGHVWVNGGEATRRSWAEGEPSERPRGESRYVSLPAEGCVQLSPPSAGPPPDCNVEPCSRAYPYVCWQVAAP